MKLKSLPRSMPLAALLCALPLAATAMESDWHPPNWHVAPSFNIGGGIGANSLNGEDYTGNGNNVDSQQVSYKGFAGLRLTDFALVEAQYIDFGTAERGGDHVKAHGVTAGGMLEAPLSRHFRPYAKAGALRWAADGSFSGVDRRDEGTDFTWGGGLRFLLARNFDVRAEYERFDFNNDRVSTVTGMLQLNF